MTEARCIWCGTDRYEAALRYEGPHATWCFHFRHEQRGGSDADRRYALVMGTQCSPPESSVTRDASRCDETRTSIPSEQRFRGIGGEK